MGVCVKPLTAITVSEDKSDALKYTFSELETHALCGLKRHFALKLGSFRASFLSMKRLFLIIFCLLTTVSANAAPVLHAESYLLMDRLTHTPLTARNENKRVNPGNTTALMVMYIVQKAISENRVQVRSAVTIHPEALSLPPLNASRFYVENSKTYSVHDLLSAVAVIGANDAAIALAQHIAGSIDAFVQMMNEAAVKLGMKNTHYIWPIAHTSNSQYTTAYDTYLLTDALLKQFPFLERVWMQPSITNGLLSFKNTNALIWRNEFIRGVHTSEAFHRLFSNVGYFSQSFVESDAQFSRETIAVCLNGPSAEAAAADTMELITWGAANFKTLLVYTPKDVIEKIAVSLSANASVRVGLKENVYLTVPEKATMNDPDRKFSATIERLDPLVAPIQADERVGTLYIYYRDKKVASAPLYALHNVQSTTFWYRAWQSVKSFFTDL